MLLAEQKKALVTRLAARDYVASLCFASKKASKEHRVPRGMISSHVNKKNQETKGLGLTTTQVYRKVDKMWAKYARKKKTSDSDTEEETESETESDTPSEDVATETEDRTFQPKPKGGRPNNTSHQDLAVKKQAKANLLNNVATDIQQLRGDMPLKHISCV